MAKSKKHWIQGAIKHPGAFRAKAKRAGMSTRAYAEKEKNAGGTLGHQARLALALMGMGKKKKRKKRARRKRKY